VAPGDAAEQASTLDAVGDDRAERARLTLRAKGLRVTRGIAGEPTRPTVAEFGLERASESLTLGVSEVASFQFVRFESPAALA
jgi:hypothetical protein